MTKIGRPPRLIAYDTEMNVEARACGAKPIYKPLRARTVIYTLLILMIGGFMSFELATRGAAKLSVLHDRNPLTVTLKDGSVRNAYTIRVSNMKAETRRFEISVAGIDRAEIEVVGAEPAQGRWVIEAAPDQTREARVLVTARGTRLPASQIPITFNSTDVDSDVVVIAKDVFVWP
jgi:polyferredoxin